VTINNEIIGLETRCRVMIDDKARNTHDFQHHLDN